MEKSSYRKHYQSESLVDRLEERAVALAQYMIENKATVRQTASVFGVSKSTAHTDVTKPKGCLEMRHPFGFVTIPYTISSCFAFFF